MLVKICGIMRQSDLDSANALGFDLCGFIFHKKSPRYIEPKIAAGLESGKMLRAGVFVEQAPEDICSIMSVAKLDYAQLHGEYSLADAQKIGLSRVIRVLWPGRYQEREQFEADAGLWRGAFYLLDSGQGGGGSGIKLSLDYLQGLLMPGPWFLAGGLTPEHVGLLPAANLPDGLDFNSGLEDSPGCKNLEKLRKAILAAREIA